MNWPEVARHFIHGIEADAAADGSRETAELRWNGCSPYPGVLVSTKGHDGTGIGAGVADVFSQGRENRLRLFTTLATLGTPRDITLQELRIESFFPIDDDTAAVLRDWANGAR